MPTVSVIIPTYKHRDFVLQTLESVFAQTFEDYEALRRPLAESGRIRYFEQANASQARARNRGIGLAWPAKLGRGGAT